MKYKVSTLEGVNLDAAVCRAAGIEVIHMDWLGPVIFKVDGPGARVFMPSREWQDGGPIIEREGISLLTIGLPGSSDRWSANFKTWHEERDDLWTGPTALIAAMRAFVGETFGDEVDLSRP